MTAARLAPGVVALALLAGCVGSGQDELSQWMSEQRNQIRPRVQPIPEPKRFTPQAYNQAGVFDPFSNQKLTQALRRESTQTTSNAALVAPELNRRKEPLEAYPLDAMTMVGSLNRGGQLVALVKVENLLYQVRPGSYLGQNYGKITRIAETEVLLREIVQDAAGEWIERAAKLQLQERAR
ncbi:MAG: pilus assembly protein PilP [Burkholderiaceae bacterium]|nr:pilus assembly protein PilP [Burkholderiaceae bacterium]MDO9090790.1 pilus assembly protein PilP [Burkholderiaceae bacterium]MDP1968513.1 pilus assembly protein PilP [Burkholderiaceae bacterium]